MQMGYLNLQMAKLWMLSFYYDCIRYIEKPFFEYIEMDMDSAYFAIAGRSLEEVVKPSKKNEFTDLISCYQGEAKGFFPRTCCADHKWYDRRQPGLFKVEAEGTEMIAMCSKAYLLKQEDDCKVSCKGVNKIQNPYESFLKVITEKTPLMSTNRGIGNVKRTTVTYTQEKAAINYSYWKRKVLEDGIDTVPLTMVLCPWKREE